MGKLTKLKEIFSKENIKKGVRLGVLTAGIAFASIGFTSCGDIVNGPIDPETDYCEICEGIQDEYHVHEQPTPEPEQPTPEQPEQPKPEKEKCTQDGCVLDKHDDTIKHDYCDKYDCGVEGNETDDTPHQHCKAEDCKDHKGAYTGEHTHVCKDAENCKDSGNFDENGKHTHDYCNQTNCKKNGIDDSTYPHKHNYCDDENCIGEDKTTNPDHDHTYPTPEPEESWFKPVSIGGSDLYQVYCIDDIQYNKDNDFTTEKKVNDYLAAYIDYINGLTLNENLTGNVENNLNNIKSYPTSQKLDLLIGTTANDTGTIYSQINGINDICAPAIEKVAQNVATTNKEMDLDYFYLDFRAFENEVYGVVCNKNQTYIDKKNKIQKDLESNNIYYKLDYSIYQADGTIHPDAVQRFDKAIKAAATKLKTQFPQIENMETIVRNYVNLSFATSGLEGILDKLCPSLGIDPETCKNNEMVNVIYNVPYEDMTEPLNQISQAKLNKSVFSQDYGRELC